MYLLWKDPYLGRRRGNRRQVEAPIDSGADEEDVSMWGKCAGEDIGTIAIGVYVAHLGEMEKQYFAVRRRRVDRNSPKKLEGGVNSLT